MESRKHISSIRIQKELQSIEKSLQGDSKQFQLQILENENAVVITLSTPTNTRNKPTYMIKASEKFPFDAPLVLCLTHFTTPTLADGRNLFTAIMKDHWDVKYTFTHIAQALPDFTEHILQAPSSDLYHLGVVSNKIDCLPYMTIGAGSPLCMFPVLDPLIRQPILGRHRFALVSEAVMIMMDFTTSGLLGNGKKVGNVLFWLFLADIHVVVMTSDSVVDVYFQDGLKRDQRKMVSLCFFPVESGSQGLADMFSMVLKRRSKAAGAKDQDVAILQSEFQIDKEIRRMEGQAISRSNIDQILALYRKKIEILSTQENQAEIERVLGKMHRLLEDPNIVGRTSSGSGESSPVITAGVN